VPSPGFENLAQLFKTQREAARGTDPTPDEMRAPYDMLGQMLPPVPDVVRTDALVGGVPSARFDPPDGPSARVILFFHGGGYCIGSSASHGPLAANLAKASGLSVILPEYRLAPEHPFPAGFEDGLAVWDALGTDVAALGGDSAGGGLALGLLVALRDAGRPLPACAVLISPWCDVEVLGEVSDEALDTDFLQPDTVERFVKWLAPDAADLRCSPGRAQLEGLPPLYIQVGEREILLDQARRLAASAKDAGVDVTLDVEPGMFHEAAVFCGAFPEATEAVARVASFVREH
jgi:epsilon-lactone hydrolase